jgi:nicotinamide phosphoribosyltransferase
MNTNPMLLIDFYKATHSDQTPKGMTKSVSYLTPRMSRIDGWNELISFGLQGFCKTWLIDYFNKYFFDLPYEDVMTSYDRVLNATLGANAYHSEKIADLHKLGYLPIKIKVIAEGTKVPIHVPMLEISNTNTKFAWLPQALESLLSTEMYHPMLSANVGYNYRQIVNKYFDLSVEDNVPRNRALGDFSFRGQECLQSGIKSSSAWCLSFLNTSNVPAIIYLEDNYNCDCTKEPVAFGSVSTEHSCQCTNFAIDKDERTHVKRLLTEIYPDVSFSMVSDSYDYWNMVDVIIPSLKEEILNHNGCFLVRGDSGNPVKIVTETVFHLWETFGGTINSKGFKVLNPHIKALYGDSITVQRCEEIYKVLIENGFACSNVSLGVGSFSFQCIEENGELKPFTRDTMSIAIKCTYVEIDGEPVMIFKDPKTDAETGCGFKKSQKGMIHVHYDVEDVDHKITFTDGLTEESCRDFVMQNDGMVTENLLETVFLDGKLVKEQSLKEIRDRLHAETGGF